MAFTIPDTTGMVNSVMTCMTNSGLMAVQMECSMALSTASVQNDPITGMPVYLNSYLDSYCGSSCFSKMRAAYSAYGNCVAQAMGSTMTMDAATQEIMTGQMDSSFNWMCTKNFATGNYCMADSDDAATYLTAATVGTDFQQGYCDYIQRMGCCFSSLMSTPSYASYGVDPMASINQLCGFTSAPPACATADKPLNYVQSTFTLSGFDYSAYQGLTDEFKLKIDAAMAADLAAALAEAKERISVTVTGSGADMEVTVSVITDDGTKAITLNGEMLTKLQAMSGTTEWSNLLSAATATGATAPQTLTVENLATKVGVDEIVVQAATDGVNNDATQSLVSLWTAAALAAIAV